MQIRFLLGPAGSGKTFRCLSEIRDALRASPDGPPLILLAPKQATFQLERQLLGCAHEPVTTIENGSPAVSPHRNEIQGYTRLRILSFERLAEFILNELHLPRPDLLNDEGRLMVLRALLSQKHKSLKLFHATARLPGFAQQLSLQLLEFQRYQISPAKLAKLAARTGLRSELHAKLHDLALLFEAYLNWLNEHQLQDAYCLPDIAADAMRSGKWEVGSEKDSQLSTFNSQLSLWLDGFAEMTPQELNLLAAVLPFCERATLAFCLDAETSQSNDPKSSWLSIGSVVSKTYQQCRERLAYLPEENITVETLGREEQKSRFAISPALAHLEKNWTKENSGGELIRPPGPGRPTTLNSVRLSACTNPEGEATLVAREILNFVRSGGRYHDVAVIVRSLENYQQPLTRVFRRYGIPIFLDQREPAAHHPLAELTRATLRVTAFDWQHDDWFGALKTGLVPVEESAVDRLETEAFARGWKGQIWRAPLQLEDQPDLQFQLEKLRQKIVPPFEHFQSQLSDQRELTGMQLADTIRGLWDDLEIEQQLDHWWGEATDEPAVMNPSGSAAREYARPTNRSTTIHSTVWNQMNSWLDNVALAFADEALPLREWLPILDAGLANLTVGVIPPAIDQVLVGTVDRSRNPDLKLAIVLGLNESVFPAPPASNTLLTETDRDELSGKLDLHLGPDVRQRIAQERYYGYIAFTRARERLMLTYSEQTDDGQTLNPSPFIAKLRKLFPDLETEKFSASGDWKNSEHISELVPALLRSEVIAPEKIRVLPQVTAALARWDQWKLVSDPNSLALSPEAVRALYGNELRTSVSALEQFAACPFQFFVNYGLRANERKMFETDPRQTGSFQHEILSRFHQQLRNEEKRWCDITPHQARECIAQLGAEVAAHFGGGVFQADGKSRFLASSLIEQLQNFIETIVGWMSQYEFDPHEVELSFGLKPGDLPAWKIELDNDRALLLRGKIDRVDLHRIGADEALAVVMDYKSSPLKIDPVLLQHGLELQLLLYLGALRHLAKSQPLFGINKLVPAGVFYVPLRARAEAGDTRRDVLEEKAVAKSGYQHSGRFDGAALLRFDNTGVAKGVQFKFSKNKNGEFSKTGNEAMPSADFARLLDKIEEDLRSHGHRIFSGHAKTEPYRKGSERACEICVCQTICRFDPWVNPFNVLRKVTAQVEDEA